MAKKYFIWKDPACNGMDIEWVELNGRAFYDLLKKPENGERRFIRLGNDICPNADVIYIEATQTQYEDWYAEYCHHKYLRTWGKGRTALSLDALLDEEGPCSLHELIADIGAEFEEDIIRELCGEQLLIAIEKLTSVRREAIELKYFICPTKSDAEIAAMLGISRKGFADRKKLALEDLKNFLNFDTPKSEIATQ